MCRASLAALALLATSLLAACGMRFSGSHSSGSSFTTTLQDHSTHSGSIGSLSADLSNRDYTAYSYGASLALDSRLDVEDYELEAQIFQDLNGDGEYSRGSDRLLAKSTPMTRDASTNRLSLNPIEFKYALRHQPVGISWVIRDSDGKEYIETRMY